MEATAHSLGNPSLARRGSSFAQWGSGTWAGWTLLASWRDVIPLARPPLLENEGRVVLCLPQLPVRFARNARATIPAETKSLTPGIPVPRDVRRRSLTLGYYGETVLLVEDPLDVTDEVIRHDGELS